MFHFRNYNLVFFQELFEGQYEFLESLRLSWDEEKKVAKAAVISILLL